MAAAHGPEWAELEQYLGERFNPAWTAQPAELLAREFTAHRGAEEQFYRTTEGYLYDLTAFAETATKEPYRALIRMVLPAGAKLLDYGCGIGSDGLRFLAEGYKVAFADFDNPSTRYLRWRLARRGLSAPVYDVERLPEGLSFDLVYSFDVLEHVAEPLPLLQRLEGMARYVAVNLISEDPADPYPLHHRHDWRPLEAHVRENHTPIAALDVYPNSRLLLYAVGKVAVKPLLSVLIPTHNRPDTLAKALHGLANQSQPQAAIEVVVAPDRCGEGTERLLAEPPLPVRRAAVGGSGPAAARNAALELARAPLLLFLDDDVEPTPGLLAEHLLFHIRNPQPQAAALGPVRFPPEATSAFMETIESGVGLFAWPQIERLWREGRPLPFNFFYTCNLSLKRSFLGGERFDERFPAALEDTELGWRLAKQGLLLCYLPGALGVHHARKEFLPFLERQRTAGEAALRCAEKHPELAEQLGVKREVPTDLEERMAAAVAAACALEPFGAPIAGEGQPTGHKALLLEALRASYALALELAYLQGIARGRAKRADRATELHREGLARHAAGDRDGAAAALQQAAQLSNSPEIANDLAVVLAERGELERAIDLLQATVAAFPDHGQAAANLAALRALRSSLAVG